MPNTNQSIKVIASGRDLQSVAMEGAENCKMQELITEKKNAAPNFSMRFFEIEPQGHTPKHSHPWEHEIYVLEGEGEIRGETNISFHSSDELLIPPNTLHQFYNSGQAPLKFLCIIPNNANYEKK